MAVAEYLPLSRLLPVILISLAINCFASLQLLWNLVKLGPKKYFGVRRREARPDVLDDPALGTHQYARMKNIRLHYVSKGPEKAPMVLFLHGFPDFWYTWRHQLKVVGQEFRAVALDMRGYSESERPQGIAEYRTEKLVGDIHDFILHMGYKKCYLVGHDWGGAVSWLFAAKYPDMVEKMIICNMPNPNAFQKHLQTHMSQFKRSWYMFFFQMPCLPETIMGSNDVKFMELVYQSRKGGVNPANYSDDDLEAYKYTFSKFADRKGPLNYYRAAMRYKPDPGIRGKVQAPTLMLWGEGDTALEKATVEPSRKYVENECKVEYLKHCKHWVHQDDPETVNRLMLDFIKGSSSKSES